MKDEILAEHDQAVNVQEDVELEQDEVVPADEEMHEELQAGDGVQADEIV